MAEREIYDLNLGGHDCDWVQEQIYNRARLPVVPRATVWRWTALAAANRGWKPS